MNTHDAAPEAAPPAIKKPKLTKKQRGFVKDYLESGNGTQAALKNCDTTDPAAAAVIASENLKKLNVASVIELWWALKVKPTGLAALTG